MKNVMNLTPEISEEELNNLDKLDFHKALFLLRTLYKKMLNVLEAFCTGGYFNVRNETLNFYYVLFKETINQVLEIKGFEDLKKGMPELFDSLIGNIEEADIEWEYGYSQMAYKFLGEIENLYIKSGTKNFKLPQVLENKLKESDNAITSHIEYEKKLWGRTEKSLDKMKKDFDWGNSSKKVNQTEVSKSIPKIFGIQVKDRYIWINNYLLSKPHAVGSNFEFFEYVRSQPANTKIERNKLPDFGGLSLKQEVLLRICLIKS